MLAARAYSALALLGAGCWPHGHTLPRRLLGADRQRHSKLLYHPFEEVHGWVDRYTSQQSAERTT